MADSGTGGGIWTMRRVTALLLGLVVALAMLHALPVFHTIINWDEFRFLSVIYGFEAGTLTSPFQTLHVQGFRWLTGVGSNEIDQILAARSIYYVLLLACCGFVYLIAHRFVSVPAALFVLLCYLSYSEVILHGTAFRFDGLAVFFLLAAMALIVRSGGAWQPSGERGARPSSGPERPTTSPRSRGYLAGLVVPAGLLAVAFMITVKSVFYLPAMVLLVLWRSQWRVRDLTIFLLAFTGSLATLYFLHRASLDAAAGASAGSGFLRQAGSRFLRLDSVFPAREYFWATVVFNVIIWYLILAGAITLLRRWWSDRRAERGQGGRGDPAILVILALIAPFASVLIYRNAFPYYYVFIMPPLFIFCGMHFDAVLRKAQGGHGGLQRAIAAFWIVAVLVTFGIQYGAAFDEGLEVQQQVVEAVHEIFPEPVTYLDRNSMIASFPKVGFFMSTIGFTVYHEQGSPPFAELLREHSPRFLIANHPALILDHRVEVPATPGSDVLRAEDYEALQQNFVHHWGPIWVAGKRIEVSPDVPGSIEILIPGPYTVESEHPVLVDGVAVDPGTVLSLPLGSVSLRSIESRHQVTLRIGDHLRVPGEDPPRGVMFRSLAR